MYYIGITIDLYASPFPIVLDNYGPWSQIPDLSTCSQFVYLYWWTSLLLTFPSVWIVTVVTKYNLDCSLWSKKKISFTFPRFYLPFQLWQWSQRQALTVCSLESPSPVFSKVSSTVTVVTKFNLQLWSWIVVASLVIADTKFFVPCAVAVAQNSIFD